MAQTVYDLVKVGESLTWRELRERAHNAEVNLPGIGQSIFAKGGDFLFELRENAQGKMEVFVTRKTVSGVS